MTLIETLLNNRTGSDRDFWGQLYRARSEKLVAAERRYQPASMQVAGFIWGEGVADYSGAVVTTDIEGWLTS